MTPSEFGLLADENVAPEVVAGLRADGWDVATVGERGLRSRRDEDIVATARAEGRVVVSHDTDFGKLAVLSGARCRGIVFLRPGHRDARFTLGTFRALALAITTPPVMFIAVAERDDDEITVRVRLFPE